MFPISFFPHVMFTAFVFLNRVSLGFNGASELAFYTAPPSYESDIRYKIMHKSDKKNSYVF